jgi:phosphate transport system substrate-binding protein
MRAIAALLAVAALLVCARSAQAAPTISLGGAQVTGTLVADLAYFYRHRVKHPGRFTFTVSGTSAGIADAARGITDAALASRALTPDDPPGLRITPIALSGVCLVTNRANPVPGISRPQLQEIVAGRATLWSQIAGSTRTDAVVPLDLGLGAGSGRVFASVFVDDATPFGWHPVTVQTSRQVRDYVSQVPGAFGYVDLALVGTLHVVPYEGVGCTRATIRSGAYPAARPLAIVTRGRPRGELKRFLRWVRTSRKARRVIATRYVVPA